MRMAQTWIIATVTVLSVVGSSRQCLTGCQCTPSNDIDCSDKNMTIIPSSAPISQINIFNFSLNSIQIIEEKAFLNKNLTHIQTLDLSYNLISDICKKAFIGLEDLNMLNLKGNKLITISAEVFFPLKNLTVLDLSKNNITNLDEKAFLGLVSLRELDLFDNILEKFNKEIFGPLISLEEIKIQFMRRKLDFDVTEEKIKHCLCERSKALQWSRERNINSNFTCEYNYEDTNSDPLIACRLSIFSHVAVSKTLITDGDLIIAIIITVGVLLLLVVALTILGVVVSHSENRVEDDVSEMGDFEPYRGHISPLKDVQFLWPHVTHSKYIKESSNASRLQLCSNDTLQEVRISQEHGKNVESS